MPWWQHSALAAAGFVESRQVRDQRSRVRQSASNTLLKSRGSGVRCCFFTCVCYSLRQVLVGAPVLRVRVMLLLC